MNTDVKVIKYDFEDGVLILKGQGRASEQNPSGINDFVVAVPYIKMAWRTGLTVSLTVDGISLAQPLQFGDEAEAIIFHDRFAEELMDFYANEQSEEEPEEEPPIEAGGLN